MKKFSMTLQILVFMEISTSFAGAIATVGSVAKSFKSNLNAMGGVDTETIKKGVNAFKTPPGKQLTASQSKEKTYQEQLKKAEASGDEKAKQKAQKGIAQEQKKQGDLTKKIETQKAAAKAEQENEPPAKKQMLRRRAAQNPQGALGGQRFSGGAPQGMNRPRGALSQLRQRP